LLRAEFGLGLVRPWRSSGIWERLGRREGCWEDGHGWSVDVFVGACDVGAVFGGSTAMTQLLNEMTPGLEQEDEGWPSQSKVQYG
jgi:hypothetical protein